MRYIDSWLTGLGLEYIIPKLKANGITTPKKLAQLTLRDMYDVVGVEDAEDRKKLYFLIQRLQTILNNKVEGAQQSSNSPMKEEEEDKVPLETIPSGPSNKDEDLRLLRRSRRNSCGPESALGKVDAAAEMATASSHVLKSLKHKAQSSQNLLSSFSTDSVQHRTSLGGISRAAPALNYAIDVVSEDGDNHVYALTPRGGAGNAFAEEKVGRPSSRPSTKEASNVSIKSYSTDNTYSRSSANMHSPKRSQLHNQPQSQQLFDKYAIEEGIDDLVPEKLYHKQQFSPSEGPGKNLRHPVKSLRRNPEIESPVHTEQHNENVHATDTVVEDMAIRVVVRKRPLSRSEINRGEKDVMEVLRGGTVLLHEPKTKVDLTKVVETQSFVFDDAFEAHETNETIYDRTIKQLVNFVFDGGKASCFAYGQTGSGKTFSMMGSKPDAPAEAKVNAGLYVLAARDIFRILVQPKYKHLHVLVSCFEIYSGKLFDLLNERSVVKCLEDAKQQVQLPGLTEHGVNNVNELLNLMAMAHTQRSTGSTGANSESSRSHQIMQIVLRNYSNANNASKDNMKKKIAAAFGANSAANNSANTVEGKLSFIDLAGSERGADTTHSSKQTRMEGAEINTSLLALKEVIRSLERKQGHTPFRGSKLTQVLKDSFVGEKTRTCMVACVSPSHANCEHTLNTLRYADRVKEHTSGNESGGNNPHVGSSNYDSLAYDYVPPPRQAPPAPPPAPPLSSSPMNSVAKGGHSSKSLKALPTKNVVYGDENKFNFGGNNANANRPTTASDASRPLSGKPQITRPNTAVPPAGNSDLGNIGKLQQPQQRSGYSNIPTSVRPGSKRAEVVDSSGYDSQVTADSESTGRRHTINEKGSGPTSNAVSENLGSKSTDPYDIKVPEHNNNHRRRREPAIEPEAYDQDDDDGYDEEIHGRHVKDSRKPLITRNPPSSNNLQPGHSDGQNNRRRVEEKDHSLERNSQQNQPKKHHHHHSKKDNDRSELHKAPQQRQHHRKQLEAERESEDESENGFGSTELIQKTLGLLSAHKQSIAEMVEVMKDEMELVQEMENVEDRNSELYIDKLESILDVKSSAISSLRNELYSFQQYRSIVTSL